MMSGLRRTAERSPAANFPHHARFRPDGVAEGHSLPQNVFHRIFIGHRFAVGEMRLNVAVQCRCQCGFTGAGLSADETQTGFRSMASSRSGSIFMVRMSGISDGITRMVTEITFLLLLMFPESDDSAGEHAAPLQTVATGGITADLNGTVHGMTGQHPGKDFPSKQFITQRHHDGGRQRMCGRTYPPSKATDRYR